MSKIKESTGQSEEKLSQKKSSKMKIVLIIAAVIVIAVVIAAYVSFRVNMGAGSISIIGGADGPTSVFLAGKLGSSETADDGNSKLKLVKKNKQEGISHLPLGIYLEVIDFTEGYATVEIQNQSGYEMTYGYEYYLDKEENGQWVELQPVTEYGWEDMAVIIRDLETNTEVCDLNVFGELSAGRYRLRKNDMEAEFELK